jgi:SOS-response transcriptional repressor LexA
MPPVKLHSAPSLDILSASTEELIELPLISESLSAGFPSPAMDFVDAGIDFNKHIIKHPSATYYGRVKGDSMKDAGIHDGDLLVIDKSIAPSNGKIAVCFIDGDKGYLNTTHQIYLFESANIRLETLKRKKRILSNNLITLENLENASKHYFLNFVTNSK